MNNFKISTLLVFLILGFLYIFVSVANAASLQKSKFLNNKIVVDKFIINDSREKIDDKNIFYKLFQDEYKSSISFNLIYKPEDNITVELKPERKSNLTSSIDNDDKTLDIKIINFFENKFPTVNIDSFNNEDTIHLKSEIYKILSYLPENHVMNLKQVKIENKISNYIGYSGYGEIIIKSNSSISDKKLRNTFLHEMGHITDTAYFGDKSFGESRFLDNGRTIYNNDPVLEFFTISWNNHISKKQSYSNNDFVSMYALENPFEDFAESYGMYVANGNAFRCALPRSPNLMLKYIFLRDKIFNGREYFTGETKCKNMGVINDATDL